MDGKIAGAARGVILIADVNKPFEKSAGRQDYFMAEKLFADLSLYTLDLAVFDDKTFDATLAQGQTIGLFQDPFHPLSIESLVSLGTRRPYSRSLLCVQYTKLNSSLIDRSTHLSPERIDLLNEMALADSPNRWIA